MSYIETINIATAADILQHLHPQHERYSPDPARWAFRGHADQDWELLPSLFREHAWKPLTRSTAFLKHARDSHDGMAALSCELGRLLSDFLRGLDESGLPIPGDSQAVRAIVARSRDEYDGELFSNEDLVPLLALARHHRLPTPFLDWTWSSRVAAYFAAVEAARDPGKKGHLCVWAFETTFADTFSRPGDGFIALITPPRATNPNMHAQSGLFTMCGGLAGWHELRQYVEHLAQAAIEDGRPAPAGKLIRFCLPRSESPTLLRLLGYERIDGARLFPGPDGVVQCLQERLLRDGTGASV